METEQDVLWVEAEVVTPEELRRELAADAPTGIEVFGAGTRVAWNAPQYPTPLLNDLKREWTLAFDAWLEHASSSAKTRTAYERAWEDFIAFCMHLSPSANPNQAQPTSDYWQITHRHVRAWIEDLQTRPLDPRRRAALRARGEERATGYSASTIQQYVAAVSSFFSFAMRNWPVMLPNGREVSLAEWCGITLNPVRVVPRKHTIGAQKREQPYLSIQQLRQFRAAIPVTTAPGVRDLALFTLYMMTGARNSEARTLQWKDFREVGGRMQWYWRGKGRGRKANKESWKDLPPECWDLICLYLKAVGRWGDLQADDYIFTAVTDNATNLPSVSAEAWDRYAQPLSAREVNRRIKLYAKRAGLDAQEIHVHTLRHSAAMLMDEVGASLIEIMNFLNHESLTTTQQYINHMKGERNVHAGKMAEALRL